MSPPLLNELLYFIKERHSIYLKKEKGLPKPWSTDEIFQKYRFCNVYRENDKTTIWIKNNIREPFKNDPNLWFMLCIARQINLPDTLEELINTKGAWPCKDKWNWEISCEVMRSRKQRGLKVYGSAYMLKGDVKRGDSPNDKPLFTCGRVLRGVWERRRYISSKMHETLTEAHEVLLSNHGWGSFLSAQVIADLKHTKFLAGAPDWWTWAASGPGSRKGLNVVFGRREDAPWKEEVWLETLRELSKEMAPHLKKWKMQPLCLQDLQNCLCETFKMVRGYGKERYAGIQD